MNTITETPKFELIITSSGLEQDRQIEIREAFAPYAEKVSSWAGKVASVDDPKVARETRLAMRRERIDLDKKHAEFKSKTLAWTRAVDGSKKVISDAYDSMESQMEEIEKAEERRIAAEKAARKAERDAALRTAGMADHVLAMMDTGGMTDAGFLALLEQAKALQAKKEADAKAAEEARIAREKKEAEERAEKARKDAEEREARRLENERLKAEAEKREKEMAAERARLAAERAEAEAKAKKEREAIEAKARAEKVAAEKKLREEREAREKLEREQRERVEAERRRMAAEAEAKRLAEQAPDAEKLRAVACEIERIKFPAFSTAAGIEYANRAGIELANVVRALQDAADELEGKA